MELNGNFRALHAGLPEDIRRMKEHGDFEGALAAIERRLACGNMPAEMRYALTAQAEMIRRLPGNFPYRRDEALELVRAHIADFGADEFDEMVRDGRVEWIYVNGEPRYFGRFFETLCKVDARFAARAGIVPAGTESPDENGESRLDRAARLMREKGSMAVRFRCRASLRVKDELFRPGMSKMFKKAKELGLILQLHSCGRWEKIIPAAVDAGLEHWTSSQAVNDIPNIIKKFGDRLTMIGGCDVPEIQLPGMTLERMREIVSKRLDIILPGGCIIPFGNSSTPFFRAAVEEEVAKRADYYQKPENRVLPH